MRDEVDDRQCDESFGSAALSDAMSEGLGARVNAGIGCWDRHGGHAPANGHVIVR